MKKILVANPFGLGDALFSMFLVEALKIAVPSAVVDFLGNERTEALLRMNGSIRRVHTLDRGGLRRLWPSRPAAFWKASAGLLSPIRNERYDTLFDLSLGREFSFYAALFGIRERFGFDFRGRGIWLTKKIALAGYEGRPVALQQLDLLGLAGLNVSGISGRLPLRISEAAQSAADKRLEEAGVQSRAFVAVGPGGGRSWGDNAVFKQWAPERFAEIARRLAERGTGVVLLGDQAERPLLERVRDASGTAATVCAGLPIGEACALLRRSRGLVANDGGLIHLASALGVPAAAIFGPADETAYGPFLPPAGSTILFEPVACRPCYRRFHFPPCPNERACLDRLTVERVWPAVSKMV